MRPMPKLGHRPHPPPPSRTHRGQETVSGQMGLGPRLGPTAPSQPCTPWEERGEPGEEDRAPPPPGQAPSSTQSGGRSGGCLRWGPCLRTPHWRRRQPDRSADQLAALLAQFVTVLVQLTGGDKSGPRSRRVRGSAPPETADRMVARLVGVRPACLGIDDERVECRSERRPVHPLWGPPGPAGPPLSHLIGQARRFRTSWCLADRRGHPR